MVEYRVHMEAGEVCKQPGTGGGWPFVAFFNVAAKLTGPKGRAQAKEIGDKARAAFEYVMERFSCNISFRCLRAHLRTDHNTLLIHMVPSSGGKINE